MMKFYFEEPSAGDVDADLSAQCQGQLLLVIREIVQAAVAAGWNRDDVLLELVELAWDLYEERR
ncbi:hypothetical protein [Mesorhizobium sp. ISC11]|uniref:hypothetical protein n=1 Tax=Mesorhizobium sp. ISC11 TaxID=3076428 RepID=UPI00301DE573